MYFIKFKCKIISSKFNFIKIYYENYINIFKNINI